MKKTNHHPLIDQNKQHLAGTYRAAHRRIRILTFILSALFVGALIIGHLSHDLADWLNTISSSRIFIIALYGAIMYAVHAALNFPFSFQCGFAIEHRFGFSTQTFRAWIMDWVKSFVLGLVLAVIVLQTIYAITYAFPRMWWLWLSLAMILFSVVLANLFPVLILPLFYRTEPLGDDALYAKIERLCKETGVRMQGVYRIDLSRRSTKANAAVIGLGATKRIVLGDTLLAKYSHDEIIAVLAHEITHYREHHVWQLILWQSAITFGAFYVLYVLHPHIYPLLGYDAVHEIASLPALVLVFGVVSFLLRPVNSGISRYYERRADRGALEITQDAASFIRVMARFCNDDLAVAYPSPLIEWYSYSHPSPGKRIAIAEQWGQVPE